MQHQFYSIRLYLYCIVFVFVFNNRIALHKSGSDCGSECYFSAGQKLPKTHRETLRRSGDLLYNGYVRFSDMSIHGRCEYENILIFRVLDMVKRGTLGV